MAHTLKISANTPVTILLSLGGLGYLAGINGAGLLLSLGVILQFAWLAKFFV